MPNTHMIKTIANITLSNNPILLFFMIEFVIKKLAIKSKICIFSYHYQFIKLTKNDEWNPKRKILSEVAKTIHCCESTISTRLSFRDLYQLKPHSKAHVTNRSNKKC